MQTETLELLPDDANVTGEGRPSRRFRSAFVQRNFRNSNPALARNPW
jgi:hypothetical protein